MYLTCQVLWEEEASCMCSVRVGVSAPELMSARTWFRI